LLDDFRLDLYKFQGKPEIDNNQPNAELREKSLAKRNEIRRALTETIEELNQTNALLARLTSQSGNETVATFNRLKYRGFQNWESRGGRVGFQGSSEADQIPIQQAVDIAVRLRCEEYITSLVSENRASNQL
jgi:hypothetical protein